MNNLQRMIAEYLADHPNETYASIGRRGGLKRQTVQHIATTPKMKQTPQPKTVRGLAIGMGYPESYVRAAAADAAGYGTGGDGDREASLTVEATKHLDPERLAVLERRARSLLREMREEQEQGGE